MAYININLTDREKAKEYVKEKKVPYIDGWLPDIDWMYLSTLNSGGYKLGEVLAFIPEREDGSGFGLWNIDDRILSDEKTHTALRELGQHGIEVVLLTSQKNIRK